MTDMNQNAMITAETEEDYPVEIVDRQMCDEREEQRKDKIKERYKVSAYLYHEPDPRRRRP